MPQRAGSKKLGMGPRAESMQRGPLSRALYLTRMAGAGAIGPFGDFADSIERRIKDPSGKSTKEYNHLPAFVEALPVLGYLGAKAVNPNIQSNYLDAATTRVNAAFDNANRIMNVEDPQDATELVVNVVGSLIVPMPGPKGGQAATKVARAAEEATRVATPIQKATRVAQRVATGAGKTAVELTVPLRQGGSFAKTAPVATGIALAANEAIDQATDNQDYHGLIDGIADYQKVEAIKNAPTVDFLDPGLAAEYDKLDEEERAQIDELVAQQRAQEIDDALVPEQRDWADDLSAKVIVGGAMLAGVFGTQAFRRFQSRYSVPTPDLVGQGDIKEYTSTLTKAQQGSVQHDQSIRVAAKELHANPNDGTVSRLIKDPFQNSQGYQQTLANLDSITSGPLNSKTSHFLTHGELPHSAVTTDALGPQLEQISRDLSPEEYAKLVDGLVASTALDDFKRTGKLSSFAKASNGQAMTPQDIQQYADYLQDPRLVKYADMVRKSYRQQLDYMEEQGLITSQQKAEWLDKRANYVHLSRNRETPELEGLYAQKDVGDNSVFARYNEIMKRSEDEAGGIKAGEAADPIMELSSTWSSLIRRAEINRVKTDLLDRFANNGALKDFVKQLPEAPDNMDGVHVVYRNGKPVYYRISDPAMSAAFEFAPFAQNGVMSTYLSGFKKFFEWSTTGPGNPLFGVTSSMYDTLAAIALKPSGYDLGLANEVRNRVFKGVGGDALGEFLSVVDPTKWAMAPVGAVRLAWDEFAGSMANELTTQLALGDGWVLKHLGPQRTDSLKTWLANRYAGSIKSIMDEYGASTTNLFNPTGPSRPMTGLIDAAPGFYRDVQARAFAAATRGDTGYIELALKAGGTVYEQAKASSIARAYVGITRLLHEGARYQAFATNLPKVIGDEELTALLASQTRRLAGDISQTGGAKWYQETAKSAAYLNVATQSLAEFGRKALQNPAQMMINTASFALPALAMQYVWAAQSPENQKTLRDMTAEQRASTIKTFGNLEIKIPAELRPLWSQMTGIMDEITGLNAGQFSPDMAKALEQWLDTDMSDLGEFKIDEMMRASGQAISPVNIGMFPLANAIAANAGLDLGFSRFTGEPQVIKPQQVDPLGGEGKLAGDAMSANMQAAVTDLVGTSIAGYMRAGLDAFRVLDEKGLSKEAMDQAIQVAASRVADNTVRAAGPVKGMLFGDYANLESIAGPEFAFLMKKRDGIESAISIYDKKILTPWTNGKDPTTARLTAIDFVDPNLAGTQLGVIGMYAAGLNKMMADDNTTLSQLNQQAQDYRNQKFSSIEARNFAENEVNEQRRVIYQRMLLNTQITEELIRNAIGDPTFRFDKFDPQKYRAPLPVQQPIAPSAPPMVP